MFLNILKDTLDFMILNKKSILHIALLYLFGFLIIPLILVEGYSYNITKYSLDATINVPEKLPEIKFNKNLLIDGIKIMAVKIVYFIPSLIIIILLKSENMIGYPTLTLLGILLFATYCLSLIACVNMIEKNSFKKAFDIKEIITNLNSLAMTYLKVYASIIVILMGIAGLTSSVLIIILNLIDSITILFNNEYLVIIAAFLMIILILCYFILLFILLPLYKIFISRSIASISNLI